MTKGLACTRKRTSVCDHPQACVSPVGRPLASERGRDYDGPMHLFDILVLIAVGAVSVTLGLGLYSLFRGGAYARSHSNRLMRLRVGLQAVAVLVLVAGMVWKATSRG